MKKVIKYNKLVRDNIPDIIEKAGKECDILVLNEEEYLLKLREKLIEEANEVKGADGDEIIDELADVLEIVEAIEDCYGLKHEQVLEAKENKAIKNGKFKRRLLLVETRE